MDDSTRDVVLRAWKDEGYRQSLPAEVRDELPARPENMGELTDEQLAQAAGGIFLPGPLPGPGFTIGEKVVDWASE